MELSRHQERMLDGAYGAGRQRALDMLVKYGRAFDADRLISVDSVHVFATDPLEFVAEMLTGVDGVDTMPTTHACYAAESRWAVDLGIPEEMAVVERAAASERMSRLMQAGFVPTLTCAPYLAGNVLRPGTAFSWPGTSGIVIGNSLFGARGNRDASPAALSSAITGFTPNMGYHKRSCRQAELVVSLDGIDLSDASDADCGAVGYAIGRVAGSRNVAISSGVPRDISFEKLKYLLSPMPVSGAVSICHIVGVTPEAPTVAAVGADRPSVPAVSIGPRDMLDSYERLRTASAHTVDMVLLGCPHCTITELRAICRLLDGRRVNRNVRFWIATADSVRGLAERMGYLTIIEEAGGRVFSDICIMNMPFSHLEPPVAVSATNSARAAHYQARGGLYGGHGVQVFYGSTSRCVESAINGSWQGE